MEKKILPKELIEKLKILKEKRLELVSLFGQLEMQIQLLEMEKIKLNNELKNFNELENQITETFRNQYGDGNIDLNTGEFTPLIS